jgi:hypothetical protein
MKMYRNYDGNKSAFGETSISSTTPDPDAVAAFAAQRSTDRALTIMVISKSVSATPARINVANFQPATSVQAWQLTASNVITHLPNVGVSISGFNVTLPPQSITLFVVPAGSTPKTPTPPGNLRVAGS